MYIKKRIEAWRLFVQSSNSIALIAFGIGT